MTFMYVCIGLGVLFLCVALGLKLVIDALSRAAILAEDAEQEPDEPLDASDAASKAFAKQLADIQGRRFAPQIRPLKIVRKEEADE